jgi:antitoxin HigA-1
MHGPLAGEYGNVENRGAGDVAILDARLPVDADTDLRLSRYFGVSEGWFLGLQNDYDLEEAKRALNGGLDRIVPRAA